MNAGRRPSSWGGVATPGATPRETVFSVLWQPMGTVIERTPNARVPSDPGVEGANYGGHVMTIFDLIRQDVSVAPRTKSRISDTAMEQEFDHLMGQIVRILRRSTPEIRQEQIRFLHFLSGELVHYQDELPEMLAHEEAPRESSRKPSRKAA